MKGVLPQPHRNRERARQLIDSVLAGLEADLVARGACLYYLASASADACVLLGFEAEARRAQAILEAVDHPRTASRATLDEWYPRLSAFDPTTMRPWRSGPGDLPGQEFEFRALARLVQGDFAGAQALADQLFTLDQSARFTVSPAERYQNVMEVRALQRLHAGQPAEAEAMLGARDASASFPLYVAWVLCDRAPWPGYPFPDY